MFVLSNSWVGKLLAQNNINQPIIYATIKIDTIIDNDEVSIKIDTSRIQVLSKEFEDNVLEASFLVDLSFLNKDLFDDLKGKSVKSKYLEAIIKIRFIDGRKLEVRNWESLRKKMILSAKETYHALKEDVPELKELAYLTYTETLKNLNTHDDVRKVVYSRLEFLLLPYTFKTTMADTLIFEDSVINVFEKGKMINVQSTHVNRICDSKTDSEIVSVYHYDTDSFNSMIQKMFEKYLPRNENTGFNYFLKTEQIQKIRYDNESLNSNNVVKSIKIELNFPRIGYTKKISTIRTYRI
ncbi:MAG: hypothetical protein ACK4WD_11390 [Flavobacteriales bacterium]